MGYKYEFISHNDNLPVKIFIHNINYSKFHWHNDLELILVLEGQVNFHVENNTYSLRENDVLLINSKTLHASEYKTSNMILALQIDPEYFEQYYPNFSNTIFDCKSFMYDEEHQADFDMIRKLLAEIMVVVNKKETSYALKILQLITEFIQYIVKEFKIETVEDINKRIKNNKKLMDIIKYIEENYTENITLKDVAKREFMGVTYLSTYFKTNMGISFIKYLTVIRLKKSIDDLIYTDMNINEIALHHGFPNTKSYYKIFKETYGMTPTQFRIKNQTNVINTEKMDLSQAFNYFEYNKSSAFKKLFSYLEYAIEHKKHDEEIDHSLKIDFNNTISTINASWRKLITFGRAVEGLRAEWQRQLKEVQKEIPFEYIRCHGIFSDDMMVYNEDKYGDPIYNFSYIDQLFDFFMEVNLKPFVEIGFMPSKLASKDDTLFYWKANVSYPTDINKWNRLVFNFVKHCVERYGIEEVRKWYFEIWNEPEIKGAFWLETDELFFQFFNDTFCTIKKVDKDLKVGGCGNSVYAFQMNEWFETFSSYCISNQLDLDFISYHIYPVVVSEQVQNKMLEEKKVNADYQFAHENYIPNVIEEINDIIHKQYSKKLEIHVTEWNSSLYGDYSNDTCFKGSFLIKNVLDSLNKIDSMGYWTFTDIFEESQPSSDLFHGGLGFITYNGLKKPMFYAYKLLHKLGNEVISKGNDYIATKKADTYQILIYNYHHYDALYMSYDNSNIDYHRRYDIFENPINKSVSINIKGINGCYYVKRYRLNQEYGSVYDHWIKMGAPEPITKEIMTYLDKQTQMQYTINKEQIKDNYEFVEKLKPHEVLLIEITPHI